MAREYPWDLLHLAYFCGYAGWNYLTTPFLFTYPGFETEEIEPWEEEGEIWRRLKVRFSPDIPTHCPEQIFHFDAKGLLRRLDYHSEVVNRSEERRVGKECVRTCRSRWSPYH